MSTNPIVITAAAGDVMVIDAISTVGHFQLESPNGDLLIPRTAMTDQAPVVVLPESGPHTLRFTGNGEYDINVFDPGTLDVAHPEYVHDFPNGKGRLCVRATGYAATLVNGQVVTEQGANTGARPGRVIRDFERS